MAKGDIAPEVKLKEVASVNKNLYKLVLYLVKVIPMVISGIYVLNTVLSYFDIDTPILSYLVQFLFIGGLYILSYVFKFCIYHRLFIHYILITLILNIIDYHFGLPVSDKGVFLLYMIITGIFLFLILYFRQKHHKTK